MQIVSFRPTQLPEGGQSCLCLTVGTAQLDADGELLEAVDLHSPFNIESLLVSLSHVKASLAVNIAWGAWTTVVPIHLYI